MMSTGRGLAIIAALADKFGHDIHAVSGTHVGGSCLVGQLTVPTACGTSRLEGRDATGHTRTVSMSLPCISLPGWSTLVEGAGRPAHVTLLVRHAARVIDKMRQVS